MYTKCISCRLSLQQGHTVRMKYICNVDAPVTRKSVSSNTTVTETSTRLHNLQPLNNGRTEKYTHHGPVWPKETHRCQWRTIYKGLVAFGLVYPLPSYTRTQKIVVSPLHRSASLYMELRNRPEPVEGASILHRRTLTAPVSQKCSNLHCWRTRSQSTTTALKQHERILRDLPCTVSNRCMGHKHTFLN